MAKSRKISPFTCLLLVLTLLLFVGLLGTLLSSRHSQANGTAGSSEGALDDTQEKTISAVSEAGPDTADTEMPEWLQPAEPEPVQEPEVRVEEDFFTMPLPTMEDIKKVQAKKPDIAETVEEDVAANVQAAMDALAVEEDSLWDSLPEDATRVIKLDELQFGRNYKKEK